MAQNQSISVLIVGAGPTGLILALWLTKIGVKVRLIDKYQKAQSTSRALVIHSRTLEFYQMLGIADKVIERSLKFPQLNLWVNQELKASLNIVGVTENMTPFPFVIIFPQDEHEDLLIKELEFLGVTVERESELIACEENETETTAHIKKSSGEIEIFKVPYIAGCDGARSKVREILNVGFEGSTYPDLFYVADVMGSGPVFNQQLHVSLNEAEFIAVFPLKQKQHARIIGVIREEVPDKKYSWDDVHTRIFSEMKIKIDEVRWFSTYHVHHRVASHFQKGRIFLLGDAGHIHSPVGGQGMNTGIGDAVNLGWKLGDVIINHASLNLLESYEPERIHFARQLVQSTDQAFRFISSSGKWARFVRTKIVPLVLPRVFASKKLRQIFFKTLAQLAITYRHCDMNKGHKGSLHAGDRLPWVESVNNYERLQILAWQVHVYGDAESPHRKDLPHYHFPWNAEAKRKGLTENTTYVIRPDGYIGFIL